MAFWGNCLVPWPWCVPLDYCSTNTGFILVSVFMSCHSVATWQLVDLWLFQHATLPLGFPVGISWLTLGLFNVLNIVVYSLTDVN